MNGVYTLAERRFRPWKNGGGETAEIVVFPPGAGFADFDWRISTAIVAQDGPFSRFAGVDRVLTVIEGGPMQLGIAGQVHLLDASSPPFSFAGDQPCEAKVTGGVILDLNVMARRPLKAMVARGAITARSAAQDELRAHFALLLQDFAGLHRLDLVDMALAGPELIRRLRGAEALEVVIRSGPPADHAD